MSRVGSNERRCSWVFENRFIRDKYGDELYKQAAWRHAINLLAILSVVAFIQRQYEGAEANVTVTNILGNQHNLQVGSDEKRKTKSACWRDTSKYMCSRNAFAQHVSIEFAADSNINGD